jgi:NSS family neurotransmitter:Na+ symporter
MANSQENNVARGQWSSKIGFFMAAAGTAIGLGNIWRFPYMTGKNGGAAFVFVYLLCVAFIGIPLMWNELALGRYTQKNPIGAITKLKGRTPWVLTGILCFLVCFLVLGYYSVIAGWTIGYIYISLAKLKDITDFKAFFETFAATPLYTIPLYTFFLFLTIWIVQAGVEKGIERWCKVMMPALFILCLIVSIRSITLPGAMKGVEYYLKPDFSKIDTSVVLAALGQCLFSLSVGWGLMVVYGSYMKKEQSIFTGGIQVAIADTSVALLGGFMVFPAVFAYGQEPGGGSALAFNILPKVFSAMPGGPIVGACFFLLLMFAALTSSISMLEVPVSYYVDEKGHTRRWAAWIVGIFAFVVGIPSALSCGANHWLTNISLWGEKGFLGIMDLIFGTLGVIVISLLFSFFSGWAWDINPLVEEISETDPKFKQKRWGLSLAQIWVFFVRFLCPTVLSVLLLNRIGVKINPILLGAFLLIFLIAIHAHLRASVLEKEIAELKGKK